MHPFRVISKSAFLLAFAFLWALPLWFCVASRAEVGVAQPPRELRVVVLRNSPPLQFYDPVEKKAAGFAVDIFNRVAKLKGYEPVYVYADTWSEVVEKVASGRADVAASLAISEERRKVLAFTDEIHSTVISLFVRARDTEIEGLKPGLKVGTTEGSVVVEYLRKSPGVRIEEYRSLPEGVFALLAGRQDAFVAGEGLVMKEARAARIEDRLRIAGEPLLNIKRAMAVGVDKPLLLARLNSGIREVEASPAYRSIYVRWYGQPAPYWTSRRILVDMSVLLAVIAAALIFWRYRTVHRLHSALQQSEERLSRAMEATSDGLWEWDLETDRVYFNANYYRMLGYEPGGFPAAVSSWQQRVHPDDLQKSLESLQACIDNRSERFEVEFRMEARNGDWKWILCRGEATRRWPDGQARHMIGTHVNITALKRAEGAVREALKDAEASRNRVNAILESVPDALVVSDGENRVLLMNQAAEELFGLKAEAVQRQPLDQVLRQRPLLDAVEGVLAEEDVAGAVDLELLHPGYGEVRQYRSHSSAIHGLQGPGAGVVTLLRDVTQERELDRLKNEFISIAAHELQTPLASVTGYADLLLREEELGPFSAQQRHEFLGYIQQKGEVLEHLIDDLLNLSRIETGRPLVLERQPCDLGIILRELVPPHQMETDRHRFEMDLPGDPVTLSLDRTRIEQVFDNLLTNAVKYSPGGGRIWIHGRRESDAFLVEVQDEGIGMTPEQVERVFEKFYRANGLDTAIRGLGLGMTIAKSIVEAHGGRIWVESEVGLGTKVSVRLPLAKG